MTVIPTQKPTSFLKQIILLTEDGHKYVILEPDIISAEIDSSTLPSNWHRRIALTLKFLAPEGYVSRDPQDIEPPILSLPDKEAP